MELISTNSIHTTTLALPLSPEEVGRIKGYSCIYDLHNVTRTIKSQGDGLLSQVPLKNIFLPNKLHSVSFFYVRRTSKMVFTSESMGIYKYIIRNLN